MRKVWITALDKSFVVVQKLMTVLKAYGLDTNGHFWVDDIKRMSSWKAPLKELEAKETALWIITGSTERFSEPAVRFGLSLIAVSLQFKKGMGFPIMILSEEGISAASLPTPLKGAEVLPLADPALGTKAAARASMPIKGIEMGYHLNIHGLPGIGLWFEVGPAGSVDWQGALFAVHAAEIDFHGVGPAGGIPERAVLEYPVKGMKLQLGEREFTAWAVQNSLNSAHSYYVRVQGMPDTILFGPHTDKDDAEVHIVSLA
jgi:hypothetical protein